MEIWGCDGGAEFEKVKGAREPFRTMNHRM